MREYQPPALIVWDANDPIFPAAGAYPYLEDLTNVDFHLFDTRRFALKEDLETISRHIRRFTPRKAR